MPERHTHSNPAIDQDIRIKADWEQSTSSVWWQSLEDDPEDTTWHSSPYQVADAGHNEDQALRLVSGWLDVQRPPSRVTTYYAIDTEAGAVLASGRSFDTEADATLAALTDGAGSFERDANGYMMAVENGHQIYVAGSVAIYDGPAKAQVIAEILRQIPIHDSRLTSLAVTRNESGAIVAIDGDDAPDLVAFWAARLT